MLVWIIDSEQWPRASLRAELIERGYDVVGFVDIASALRELSAKPAIIILEVRGQELTSQSLRALSDTGVPIVLLGGAAELREPLLASIVPAATFTRPILLGDVADFVQKAAPLHRP